MQLLSLILGQKVEVVEVLPNESDRISQEDSLLIMDIVVRTETGELINVEIQRCGYMFQGERMSCYSADLLMRELTRKKAQLGENFKYSDMKKVYTIILIEKSPKNYKDFSQIYMHRGKVTFDSGINLEMLQEYIIIPLDVFREMHHNELSKLEAWLYLIGSDLPRDIGNVIEAYPEFRQIYGELAALRFNTKELINMYDVYRDALRVADSNTVKYMYELQQEELEKIKAEIDAIQAEKDAIQAENEELRRRLLEHEVK